jgi:hypothetical protein
MRYKVIFNKNNQALLTLNADDVFIKDGCFNFYKGTECERNLISSFSCKYYSFYKVEDTKITIDDLLDEDVIDFINKMKA